MFCKKESEESLGTPKKTLGADKLLYQIPKIFQPAMELLILLSVQILVC